MTEYIRDEGLLPAGEVDRLIAATPTAPLTQADFERLGFANWRDWLDSIPGQAPCRCNHRQLLLQIA